MVFHIVGPNYYGFLQVGTYLGKYIKIMEYLFPQYHLDFARCDAWMYQATSICSPTILLT